jgi:hypothetical protein
MSERRVRARAVEGDYGHANTGTEQVAVSFELEDGERRTWYGYFTDKAAERTLEALTICGVTNLETLEGIDANEVELVLRDEEYEGTVRERVAFVNRLGSGGIAMKNRMGEKDKKDFAKRFKGQFLKLQKENGAAPAPATRSSSRKATGTDDAAAPEIDDDIPF